jgi:hypothetical protein
MVAATGLSTVIFHPDFQFQGYSYGEHAGYSKNLTEDFDTQFPTTCCSQFIVRDDSSIIQHNTGSHMLYVWT